MDCCFRRMETSVIAIPKEKIYPSPEPVGQYAAVFIVIIMALLSTIIVIAQSQNETNETAIGEYQSINGRISCYRI
jgi:hypothetical protein